MCSGSPNSRIARGGLQNGMRPPNVKAEAMSRGGMWMGRKWERLYPGMVLVLVIEERRRGCWVGERQEVDSKEDRFGYFRPGEE